MEEEQEPEYEVVSIREFSRRAGCSDTAIKKYYLDTLKIPMEARTVSKGGQPRLFYELAKQAYLQHNPTVTFDESNRQVPQGEPEPKPEPEPQVREKRPRTLTPKPPQTKQNTGSVSLSERHSLRKKQTGEEAEQEGEEKPGKKVRRIEEPKEPTEEDIGKLEILESERRQKSAAARIKEMELLEKQGKLVDKAKQDKLLFQFGIQVRDKMLSIPSRVVDLVRAADDRAEGEQIMTNEIINALTALSEFKG